jgi:4-carboxymuconolactone decarboxylase
MSKIKLLAVYIFVIISSAVIGQVSTIYPKGNKSPNVNHTGDVWLHHVTMPDSIFNYSIAEASFAPGAKLNWHIHPGGQQLIITDGIGYYQERGESVKVVKKGDVIKCQPGVEHWHGASHHHDFVYIGVTEKTPTKWLEKVSDADYDSAISVNLEKEITELSRLKWQWMSDKDISKLEPLFHQKAEFVHMGGTWGKEQEINVIKSGNIWYKKADIHDVSINILGNTVIVYNRITLLAVVGGNEVTNNFMVTEVYVKEGEHWKMGSMAFTKLIN